MAPAVLRITAPNPGPGTHDGTNTYLVHEDDGFIVIDPGPDIAAHLSRIIEVTGGSVSSIVLTHGHPDHCTLAPALAAATSCPIWGFAPTLCPFSLDGRLAEGYTIGPLEAIHTPGHSPDHLCLAYRHGLLFTGDLVMGWASTVVSPPNGRMADYFRSLERLLQRNDRLYLPGHGPPVSNPLERTQQLLERRRRREGEILASLARPTTIADLLGQFYSHLPATLHGAARRTLHAHLVKLAEEERVLTTDDGETWMPAGAV